MDMDCDFIFNEDHQAKVNKFVELTTTSDVFASEYLPAFNWDLNIALENYFVTDVTKEDLTSQVIDSFKVLSWNLDGLDENQIELRTRSTIITIKEINPDFIFLQELVSKNEAILKESLSSVYEFFVDHNSCPYYCGILVKKHPLVKIECDFKATPFLNSTMGRTLLSLHVAIGGLRLRLMTSHLESCKESSSKRKAQLGIALSEMTSSGCCCVFAGDTNLRDFEVRAIGGLPPPIVDLGSALALPTWDPRNNHNICRSLSHVPGIRFDRMFFLGPVSVSASASADPRVSAQGFSVVTGSPVDAALHPSDHWAILGAFSLLQPPPPPHI